VSNLVSFSGELYSYFANEVLRKIGEVIGLRHQFVLEEIGLILNRITVPNEELVEMEEAQVFG
jgi:hypothetical protein